MACDLYAQPLVERREDEGVFTIDHYSLRAANTQRVGCHPALAIFDVFKGQTTDAIYEILEQNNIFIVKIPANCTDRLQPMDLSVNKAVKDFMRKKFMEWHSAEVMEKMKSGTGSETSINFKLSTMKPIGAKWMVQLFDYLNTNSTNGFKAAGIVEALSNTLLK